MWKKKSFETRFTALNSKDILNFPHKTYLVRSGPLVLNTELISVKN